MSNPLSARWVSYDTTGFVAMPWRLGSVTAPIRDGAPLDRWQRRYDHFQRLIALEVVGSHGAVHQLARALRNGEPVSLYDSDSNRRRRSVAWARGGLAPFYKRLPSGPTHALFLHPQALPGEADPRRPVYAVGREEDPAHAYRMLNAALPIPLLPAWTAWLLDKGRQEDLVFDLESDGLWALEIVPDIARWAEIVRNGLTTGALRWTS